ncbi:MAG: hypothetical protein Q8L26_03585 [Candidatus Omnitrophota bacterium]|nr:hypothetical protein [Candidatus Omnitrophota bacterium]
MMFIARRKAQSLAEYAIILSIVSAALLAMSFYIKRGIQGRVRDMTKSFIGPTQYEYANMETASTAVVNIIRPPQVETIAGRSTTKTASDTQTRTATEYSINDDQFPDLLPITETTTDTNIN